MRSEAGRKKRISFLLVGFTSQPLKLSRPIKKLIFHLETAEETENVHTEIVLKSFAVRVQCLQSCCRAEWKNSMRETARLSLKCERDDHECVWWSRGDARFIAFGLCRTQIINGHLVSSGLGSITVFHFSNSVHYKSISFLFGPKSFA